MSNLWFTGAEEHLTSFYDDVSYFRPYAETKNNGGELKVSVMDSFYYIYIFMYVIIFFIVGVYKSTFSKISKYTKYIYFCLYYMLYYII